MAIALLLIDIQNDYFPGGAMEIVGAGAAAAQAAALLTAFRERDLPIAHIQHISVRPGAKYLLPGTPGAEIHASVRPAAGEIIIQKHFPNSFRSTSLLEQLRDRAITELVIAGMMTHMCVDTTTRAAADLGFTCSLAHDACATKALSFNGVDVDAASVHAAYCAALQGMFARVLSAQELRAALPPVA